MIKATVKNAHCLFEDQPYAIPGLGVFHAGSDPKLIGQTGLVVGVITAPSEDRVVAMLVGFDDATFYVFGPGQLRLVEERSF